MNMRKFDIAIIGGGPAGASAAMLLSGRGYSVALVEKKTFPREVLCGEFISREVTEFLKSNLLFNDFLNLGANPIKSFRLIGSNGENVFSPLNFLAYGIRRSKFDSLLLMKAREKGTEIFQPAEVIDLKIEGDRHLIKVKLVPDNEFTIDAKIIIAAYGKQSILDKQTGRGFHSVKSGLNGIKYHIDKSMFNSFNPEEIILFNGRDIYLGLNGVDENKVTLCYLEKRNPLHQLPKERLLSLRTENRQFAKMLKDDFFNYIEKLPVYGTGNIYFGRRDIVRDGIFYIGDSAGVIAPLVGDGIGMAIQSAMTLSNILLRNNLEMGISAIEYKEGWKKLFLRRIYIARFIQKSMLNSSFRKTGIKIISAIPGALPMIINYTRG